jgi:sugar fermentation stimulation protein A
MPPRPLPPGRLGPARDRGQPLRKPQTGEGRGVPPLAGEQQNFTLRQDLVPCYQLGAMRFATPVIRGTLIQRYKRFLADVRLDDGRTVTATCPNTGSMLGLTSPGSVVWLSESDSPTRKYRFTWEMVEADLGRGPTLVGINTQHPNKLVAEAMAARRIKYLAGYPAFRREVRYGENSRIDILLECATRGRCYVEIKNVHLSRRHGLAEFPDSVTARGTKHLLEMTQMVRAGHRAVMLFLIQRSDAKKLALARDVDPNYGAAFDAARAAGVEAIALRCRLSTEQISIDRAVPITG